MTSKAARAMLAALLAAAINLLPIGEARANPVAFAQLAAGNGDLGQAISIRRARRALSVSGRFFDLEPGDEIYVRDPAATVIVRYLGNNAADRIRRRSAAQGAPDYTVRSPALPGLSTIVFNWLVHQFTAGGSAQVQEVAAASRMGPGHGCGDGRSPVRVIGAAAEGMLLAAGERSLRLSWSGGHSALRYSLAETDTGEVLASGRSSASTCAIAMGAIQLKPGKYRLDLQDGAAAPNSLPVEVVAARPDIPRELAQAPMDEVSRQLYYASWMSVVEKGRWSVEAQQLVLGLDSGMPAVRDWLVSAKLQSQAANLIR